MKQLIFVVETDNVAKSDDRYIKRLIIERYELKSNEYKLQFVHMAGKDKYERTSIISEINKLKKECDGENIILYCFDTDKISSDSVDRKKFDNEKNYCFKNGYRLIWFNLDIEYVLLGNSVESSKKKQESIRFNNSDNINLPINKLFSNNEDIKGSSNIYLILDEILPIKNKYR